ncbi:protein DOG1-like 4 [Neltuma alba]|uniref:protein DOG1-like 4 n=1 Tax=Neltuma alba TaxID=207710 RepID=UPI0010A2B713|nr:protein DOG1-like 4 [Prosopis alba]
MWQQKKRIGGVIPSQSPRKLLSGTTSPSEAIIPFLVYSPSSKKEPRQRQARPIFHVEDEVSGKETRLRVQLHHGFSDFYRDWLLKLEDILHHLMEVQVSKQSNHVVKDDQHLQVLVSTVTTHLKEYYTVKWASARDDVLPFFSPAWLTPLENAYSSWLTGWKPSAAFRLLSALVRKPGTALAAMTEEQRRKIEELRMKVRVEEEKVEREMERLQVAMADRKMAELAKLSSRHGHGVADGLVEVALKGVMGGLEKVMKAADCVRLKTLKGTLDVLTPLQRVQFLAATLSLYLRLRQWGMNVHLAASELNIQDK